jgi:hypothetical protein
MISAKSNTKDGIMVPDKKTPEREKEKTSIELLRKLREKLFSENISAARLAAHHLGWLQDDGLVILKEALFGDYSRTVKKAAAYGLRSMRGRMVKLAKEVLQQGLIHKDPTTQAACYKSLQLSRKEFPQKVNGGKKPSFNRINIKDLPADKSKTRKINHNRHQ